MVVVKWLVMAAAVAPFAAAEFSLTIANPVAAQIAVTKTVGLAVRAEGCADLSKATITASATRIESGARVSIPLGVAKAEAPGVFGVAVASRPGSWVFVITGDCQGAKAGAIVPMPERGPYDRDKVKLFPHAPTESEIGAALREGGAK